MRPILVTGGHRTGTTWVGRILSSSPNMTYISEPLNVKHSRGVLDVPVEYWYMYICKENQHEYLDPYKDTINFRFQIRVALQNIRSWKDLAKVGKDQYDFIMANTFNHRPLIKDPFALFSAPWFYNEFGSQIVITVRHPLAFASSLKRLGWTFDFSNFLKQPLLMRDYLDAFHDDIKNMQDKSGDIISQAILLWKIIHATIYGFKRKYQKFVIIKHEDLSLSPIKEFKWIFQHLGLEYTDKVEAKIMSTTSGENPDELPPENTHGVHLDSRANIKNWRKRLSKPEIERILGETEDDLYGFYSPGEWRSW